jgi:hypothetical protein
MVQTNHCDWAIGKDGSGTAEYFAMSSGRLGEVWVDGVAAGAGIGEANACGTHVHGITLMDKINAGCACLSTT